MKLFSGRKRIFFGFLALLGLAALAGCDAFPIHYTSPGYESDFVEGDNGTGRQLGAGGTGVGRISQQGGTVEQTGTTTQRLSSGNAGVVSSPGPGRSGR
ncbi:hypothetical protein CWRG_02501 [Chthonomonas calidirosea]|uniref:Lipoprotein n=1 Tax=Chthonomonas calidirosea (strain DSM 23976 / ICMP 18418 / T49) TaxID=1303518 RepID=S0EYH5_CHTCT|nr:hypothetical protein [Chthonomonas calidirosea]CCW35393.1 hypothetical protein CCALI_01577 [Chthonomonas calidirosea T49]CEK19428.1 hypothetical protein CWRG_02501 [Chthonomonas calidirosea]CEK19429.1 hypothetical protein CP488_02519 [Chthonomonas calidirosea]CEK20408.1 hypothetical protein CTKA_02523 [Chthonomonas calidirosea]